MAFETSIRLIADSSDLETGARKAQKALKDTGTAGRKMQGEIDKSTKQSAGSFDRLRQSLTSVRGVLGGVGIALAIRQFSTAMSGAVRSATEFESKFRQIEQLIQTTGGASGKSAAEIERLSRAIGANTLASAKDVRSAAGQLLTFKTIAGDVFDRTLVAAQDLASLGFGSVQSSAVQLAKALESPAIGLTMLRRVGVSFTESQQKLIKSLDASGKALEAQQLILKAVEGQVAGSGAAAAQNTTAGAVDRLGEAWDRLNETMGRSEGLRSAFNAMAQFLEFINRGVSDVAFLTFRDLELQLDLVENSIKRLNVIREKSQSKTPLDEDLPLFQQRRFTDPSERRGLTDAQTKSLRADLIALNEIQLEINQRTGSALDQSVAVVAATTAATNAAAAQAEKRANAAQKVIDALNAQEAALDRTAEQQELFNALTKAGTEAETKLGLSVRNAVESLQQARAEKKAIAEADKAAAEAAVEVFRRNAKAIADVELAIAEQAKATTEANATVDKSIKAATAQNKILLAQAAGHTDLAKSLERELRVETALAAVRENTSPEKLKQLKEILETNERLRESIAGQVPATEKATEAAKEWERIWNVAAENIQTSLRDTFRDALDGNIRSIKDFAKSFKNFMLDAISDIAAAMVFKPTVQTLLAPAAGAASTLFGLPTPALAGGAAAAGGMDFLGLAAAGFAQKNFQTFGGLANFQTLGGSIAGGLGLPVSAPALLGPEAAFGTAAAAPGAGLSAGALSGLGAAASFGLPFAIGLATGQGLPTSALSGLGGLAGFAIGGPVGGAIGGLAGSFLGGSLFGGKKPKTPKASGILTVDDLGQAIAFADVITQGKSAAQAEAADTINRDLVKTLDALRIDLQATGFRTTDLRADRTLEGIVARENAFRVSTDIFRTGSGAGPGGHQDFDRIEDAVGFFLDQFAREGGFAGLPGRLDQVIRDEGLQAAQAGIAFFDQIERSIRALDEPLALALDDVTTTFDAMAEQAEKFGADMVAVERLRQRDTLAAVLAATESQIAAFKATSEAAADLEFKVAFALRDTIQQIDLALAALATTVGNVGTAAQDFSALRSELLVGDLSPLSLGERLAESRGRFAAAVTRAEGGDAAAFAEIPELATGFLELSKKFNASSDAFANDFAAVDLALSGLGLEATTATDKAVEQITLLGEIRDALLDPGGPQAAALNDQIAKLQDLSAATDLSFGAIVESNRLLTSIADQTGQTIAQALASVSVLDQVEAATGANADALGLINATLRSIDDSGDNRFLELVRLNVDSRGGFQNVVSELLGQNALAVALNQQIERAVADAVAALPDVVTNVTTGDGATVTTTVDPNRVAIERQLEAARLEARNIFPGGDITEQNRQAAAFQRVRDLEAQLGFQHGGSFTVGGIGGPDSQNVGFRATPGENVRVFPPSGDPVQREILQVMLRMDKRLERIEQKQDAIIAGQAVTDDNRRREALRLVEGVGEVRRELEFQADRERTG